MIYYTRLTAMYVCVAFAFAFVLPVWVFGALGDWANPDPDKIGPTNFYF